MVDILLATYNGEQYLREQLDSLLAQSYQDFRILIRDDGSTDGTMDIVQAYKLHHADKIEIIEDDVECGSPTKNFLELMKHAKAEYVMFCDQDDFWFPEKVAHMLARMQAEEKRTKDGAEPLLVFSDYVATDIHLQPLRLREDSLQVGKYYHSFNRLLVQNYVTGCTMMINKTACLLVGDYDPRMLMHDWWIALYVSAIGHIVHMPEKLMDYRQHGDNDVGAKNVMSMRYRIDKLFDKTVKNAKNTYYDQAQLLYERHYADMPMHSREVLDEFLSIRNCPKAERVHKLIQGGYLKSDFVRTLGQLFYV